MNASASDTIPDDDSMTDDFADVLTLAGPCAGCREAVPTYKDPETGDRLCVECLERAVEFARAQIALSN